MTDDDPMFLSRKGDPMETIEWARAFEDTATRLVAVDLDEDTQTMVSTIWEGITKTVRGGTFETAVLVQGDIIDLYRWYSEEEAFEGHAGTCRKVLGREPRPEDGYRQRIIDHDTAHH